MTNYEKIKAMSVEEMVRILRKFIRGCVVCPAFKICQRSITDKGVSCDKNIQEWLESEVEENG